MNQSIFTVSGVNKSEGGYLNYFFCQLVDIGGGSKKCLGGGIVFLFNYPPNYEILLLASKCLCIYIYT